MGKIKLYLSKGIVAQIRRKRHNLTDLNLDIPNPAEILKVKKDAIARFIYVVVPIRDLYQLPQTSVNIFWDPAGSTIAFNRNASIFLNLRYYEAWRMHHLLSPYHLRSSGCEQTMTKSGTETVPMPIPHGTPAFLEAPGTLAHQK